MDGDVPAVAASHLLAVCRLFESQGYRLLDDIRRGSLYRWVFSQLVSLWSLVSSGHREEGLISEGDSLFHNPREPDMLVRPRAKT